MRISSPPGGSITTVPLTNFTPTFTFATPGDLAVAYTAQVGLWWQLANSVFFQANINFTPTFTTATGAARIPNLPQIIHNLVNGSPTFVANVSGVVFSAGVTQVIGSGVVNSTIIVLGQQGSGVALSNMSTTNFVSGTPVIIRVAGTYSI